MNTEFYSGQLPDRQAWPSSEGKVQTVYYWTHTASAYLQDIYNKCLRCSTIALVIFFLVWIKIQLKKSSHKNQGIKLNKQTCCMNNEQHRAVNLQQIKHFGWN